MATYRIEFDGLTEATGDFPGDVEACVWFAGFVAGIDEEEAEIGTLELRDPTGEIIAHHTVY